MAVTDISVVSGTAVLLRNGSLSVTEVFHTDLNQTTYCLVYFAFQRSEIVFNVAHRVSSILTNNLVSAIMIQHHVIATMKIFSFLLVLQI